MARISKKKETAVVVTRAEKKDATKTIIRELLAVKPYKHNELIDETAKIYTERFSGEETDNVNDVKGRVGSVLDIMKKESDVAYEGGMYALKARLPVVAEQVEMAVVKEEKTEKPVKKAAKKTVKSKDAKTDETKEIAKTETKKQVAATAKNTKTVKAKKIEKTEEKPVEKTDEAKPLPAAPLQPIAPVAPVTPEVAPEPIPEKTEEKKTSKKRATKAKAKTEETSKEEKKKQEPILTDAKEEKTENEPPMVAVREEKKAKAAKEIQEEKAPILEPVAATKTEEKQEAKIEEKIEKPVITNPPVVKEKAEIAMKNVVMDMSFLFGDVKPKTEKTVNTEKAVEKTVFVQEKQAETQQKMEEKTEQPTPVKQEKQPEKQEKPIVQKLAQKQEQKKAAPVQKQEPKQEPKQEQKQEKQEPKKASAQATQTQPTANNARESNAGMQTVKKPTTLKNITNARLKQPQKQPLTADEKLREAFLKRMRTLGGDYFEYYSVYLLERYSMKNGRRLEGLRVSGGERDGGIDGEIELTDGMGFRETIYIQSKNWDPEKGDEKLWVVGETLLQQFIGACMCRQAKDGKQHTRGIFVTTSRFTPEAKRLLDTMSDKIVGYDGNDLYETAKECQFGLLYENGNWKLDEKLLSGEKAFFRMY